MPETAVEFTRTPPERDVYSVSRLNREVRSLLETGFSRIWLEGELSNIARPSSGHLYFTLKDAQAQVSAAMFRNRSQLLQFTPEEGSQVLVRAKVSLYEQRGNYQIIVEQMEEAGDGALRRAFEELKKKLALEGLFDEQAKLPIPALPRRVGVITSPTGAAIRDVLTVLRRRFPAIPVLIYPVPVQGKQAAGEIAGALALASERDECEVLILARGGGSLEDLWAFNEEVVARAIHACRIPVVSAIGHEIDFTIADFVADRRAPTPSAAAELVSPDQLEWQGQVRSLNQRIGNTLRQRLDEKQTRLNWLNRRLQQLHPGQYLRQKIQRLDEIEQRSRYIINSRLRELQANVNELHAQLQRFSPAHCIRALELQRQGLARRVRVAAESLLGGKRQLLAGASRALDTVSPLATLERGYAIVSRLPEHGILRKASLVQPGDRVEARLSDGTLECIVDKVR